MNNRAIIIYGPFAVGKLTVAKELQKRLDYKLAHNHLIIDLVYSFFKRKTIEGKQNLEDLRRWFWKRMGESSANFISTHTYVSDYVSPTGLVDPQKIQQLESILKEGGCSPIFIHLIADKKTLLSRVTNEDRKSHGKLTCAIEASKELDKFTWDKPAPVENSTTINTTNLSINETVDRILKVVGNK